MPVAVETYAGDLPATIATTKASRDTKRLAAAIAAGLILVSGIGLPFATLAGPEITAFLPIFATWVAGSDLLTSYLLYHQAKLVGSHALRVLACGYLFTGAIAGFQLLVFPGVFSATGLAGPQSAVWLWMVWHGGFAAYVLAYALLVPVERRGPVQLGMTRYSRPLIGTLALLALLALIDTVGEAWLPVIVVKGNYRASFDIGVAPIVLALNIAALAALIRATRAATIVQTWLLVATLASFLDAAVTLTGGARFSVGWYLARIDSLLASAVILASLQQEMVRLYREVVRLNRRLAQMAAIDGLTGIANRRRFDEALKSEWRRCRRAQAPLSLLMMDVDFFKKYNDLYGHPAGDACLQAVARAVAAGIARPGDLAARYGGEEFAALLPQTGYDGARNLAEHIRANLRDLALPHPATESGHVTVSIGIATMVPTTQPDDEAAILKAADAALYRAKRNGRDRFEFAA